MICVFCRPYFCLWVNKPFLAINEIVYKYIVKRGVQENTIDHEWLVDRKLYPVTDNYRP